MLRIGKQGKLKWIHTSVLSSPLAHMFGDGFVVVGTRLTVVVVPTFLVVVVTRLAVVVVATFLVVVVGLPVVVVGFAAAAASAMASAAAAAATRAARTIGSRSMFRELKATV